MKNFLVTDIDWDIDDNDTDSLKTLPESILVLGLNVSLEEEEDQLSDLLSDTFGFCHLGFKFQDVATRKLQTLKDACFKVDIVVQA